VSSLSGGARPLTGPTEKHVLNEPSTLVVDSLKGLVALNPFIHLDEAQRGVYARLLPLRTTTDGSQ
jgi:hypothetical protein